MVIHLQQVWIIVLLQKKTSTASSTSVKNTYNEESGKIAAGNEPQENEPFSDVISIEDASL